MKSRFSYGFTIVELLVVIVIIAILASITLISYTGINDRAKTAQALTNANAVQNIAEIYSTELGHYPDTVLSFADAITAKLPSTVTVLVPPSTLDSTNGATSILWTYDGTPGSSTGGTIQYWDFNTNAISTNVIRVGTGIGKLPPVKVNIYAWGAGGAGGTAGGWSYGAAGGAGGAAQGLMDIVPDTTYSVIVGGAGIVNSYNSGLMNCAVGGGGCASRNNSDNRYGSGGGGYSGLFSSSTINQANALLIAGGGGGGGSSRAGTGNAGGAGGGLVGEAGFSPYDSKTSYRGNGGTQTAAGADASCDNPNIGGGQGALQGGGSKVNSYGGAGGGGYFGGSGGGYSESNTMGGGGGGSSYYNSTIITSPVLTTGAGIVPGDSSNSLRGNAGNAGVVAGNGTDGKLIIVYKTTDYSAVNITGGTITTSGINSIATFSTSGTIRFTAS